MSVKDALAVAPDSRPARSGPVGGAPPPRLALRAKDAAWALGIGERLLWSLTNRGEIPHVRLGRTVLYPVDELRRWLSDQATGKKTSGPSA